MELRPVPKTGQTVPQKTGEEPQKPKQADPAPRSSSTDQLALSREALAYLEEQAAKARETTLSTLAEPKEKEDNQGDALDKAMKTMRRCQEIARRIMRGDHVPAKDRKYLLEHDSKGYQMAMVSRRHNPDPKKWESLVDKEEREDKQHNVTPTSAPTSAPSVLTSAPVETGEVEP